MDNWKEKTGCLVHYENCRDASLRTPQESVRDGVKQSLINFEFSRLLRSNAHCQRSGLAMTK